MAQDYTQNVSIRGYNPLADDILMYDNFEGRLNWTGSGTGTDFVVALSTGGNEMVDGMQGLKLQTKATTPAAGDEVTATRSMFVTPHRYLTFSGFFRFLNSTTVRRICLRLLYYSGAYQYRFAVGYTCLAQRLDYLEYSEAWWPVPGGSIVLHPDSWHRLAFTVDLVSLRIIAVSCDTLSLLSLDLEPPLNNNTSGAHIDLSAYLSVDTAAQATSYLDHLFLVEQR